MEYVQDFFANILNIVKTIEFADIIDILILTLLLYKAIKMIRETRAQQLTKGIVFICIAYFIVRQLKLKTMGFLLQNFFEWGIIAILIMFQPELRRMLEKVGRTKVSKFNVFSIGNDQHEPNYDIWYHAINSITEATVNLASTKTGALIVIERQTKLGEQIDTGTILKSKISSSLLENIFYKNTPLHDGAVIIREGIILAAGCFLPKPQKEELINKKLGSRHRAGIGMSENSDAIIIIVSEETGSISIAQDGQLTKGFTKENLLTHLRREIIPEKQPETKHRVDFKNILWRNKN